MKNTLKLVVMGILMVVLTFGTVAIAEFDLSGMTAEELTEVISRAGAELKRLEPLEDTTVLYDKDGFTAAIDYIELKEEKDEIWIHLLTTGTVLFVTFCL